VVDNENLDLTPSFVRFSLFISEVFKMATCKECICCRILVGCWVCKKGDGVKRLSELTEEMQGCPNYSTDLPEIFRCN